MSVIVETRRRLPTCALQAKVKGTQVMRWQQGRRSENVEDRRGMPRGPVMVGGGLGMLVLVAGDRPVGRRSHGALAASRQSAARPVNQPADGEHDEIKEFVQAVLADTEDVWRELFRQQGRQYREPKLVLFSGQRRLGLRIRQRGRGAVLLPGGPEGVSRSELLRRIAKRASSAGRFRPGLRDRARDRPSRAEPAWASPKRCSGMRGRVSEEEYNQLSVRLELQADFLAGVWAHHAQRMKNILEPGDIEEGLRAASAIGDDKLQMQIRGYVVPDSFTHGSSAERVRWFRRGPGHRRHDARRHVQRGRTVAGLPS